MHYTIERINEAGEILDSSKRAGNEPGKAQSFTLARQLGKRFPTDTILVTEIISKHEENIIAVYNPQGKLTIGPDVERLDLKFTAFEKKVIDEVQKEIDKGHNKATAIDMVFNRLHKIVETGL